MKRIHRQIAMLLALCLTAASSAVPVFAEEAAAETSSEAAAAETGEASGTEAAESLKTEYPLTITTYNYEREEVTYTFEQAPERVWAQSQNNIETLLALGLGDKIVGACGLDGEIREDLADEFAKINYYESMPPKEDVIALEPDFITGWYSTFSDDRLGDVDFWHERGVGTYMSLNSACRGSAADAPQTVQMNARIFSPWAKSLTCRIVPRNWWTKFRQNSQALTITLPIRNA